MQHLTESIIVRTMEAGGSPQATDAQVTLQHVCSDPIYRSCWVAKGRSQLAVENTLMVFSQKVSGSLPSKD